MIHEQPTANTFSLLLWFTGISNDFKDHLVFPSFATCKTGPTGRSDVVVERVFKSVAAVALHDKRIDVATTDNGTNNMIKGMRN